MVEKYLFSISYVFIKLYFRVVFFSGKCSVIRVNGTRWVAHMVNALENLLNGLAAHIDSYNTISLQNDYSAAQRAKAKFFKKKLEDQHFMSSAIFLLDICRAMSIFSKVKLAAYIKLCFMAYFIH